MPAHRQSPITNHQSHKTSLLLAVLIAVIYFAVGIAALKDYGINWDEPVHFSRGQAYLYYLTTGKTEYENLPPYVVRGKVFDEEGKPTKEEAENTARRSVFQNPTQPPSYWLEEDIGHPPLNGILAVGFNRFFFGALGIAGDIASYHIFEILIAALLVGLVFLWGAEAGGVVAGTAAALALGTYPLFFAEAHFNIKDPVEALFFILTLYLLWQGTRRGKGAFFWWAGLAFGAGAGVKFNILFAPVIFGLWLICWALSARTVRVFDFLAKPRVLMGITGGLVLGGTLFYLTWPYLWHDTVARLGQILNFYRGIGSGTSFQSEFVTATGWNGYPLVWIVRTTPEVVLGFAGVGVLVALWQAARKDATALLWVILLGLTILRVSIPGTTIYGGVRQIMEFVPALALLAGLGIATALRALGRLPGLKLVKNPWVGAGLTALVWTPVIATLVTFHPNQNVYFNAVSGGLARAVQDEIPAAGNTYGNAFLQGMEWLNENAEEGAQLALPVSTASSLPVERLRGDIQINDVHFSGPLRLGEYVMELNYIGFPPKTFATEYLQQIEPMYEVKVEGVPLLKIWKNDRQRVQLSLLRKMPLAVQTLTKQRFLVQFPAPRKVWSIAMSGPQECAKKIVGHFIVTSADGEGHRMSENTPVVQQFTDTNRPAREVFFRFAGVEANSIIYEVDDLMGCQFTPTNAVLEVSD